MIQEGRESMMVKIYNVDQNTNAETFECEASLREVFEDETDYAEAYAELKISGRFWSGGGAAQLFLLKLVAEG